MTYRERRFRCLGCGDLHRTLLWDHDAVPPCQACGGSLEDLRGAPGAAAAVIGDECDIVIEHGLCHPDGTPRRFRSKSEIRAAEKALGVRNRVEHIGQPGSDKSPHTSRWV